MKQPVSKHSFRPEEARLNTASKDAAHYNLGVTHLFYLVWDKPLPGFASEPDRAAGLPELSGDSPVLQALLLYV